MQTLKKSAQVAIRFLSSDGVFLISICLLVFAVGVV